MSSEKENTIHSLFNNISAALEQQGKGKGDWWQSYRFPEVPNFSVDKLIDCARSALFGLALGGGPAVRERTFETFDPVDHKQINTKIQHYITNLGGRLVYARDPISDGEKASFFYVFSGGAIIVSLSGSNGDTYTDLTIVGTSESHLQVGQDLIDTCIKGKDEQVETEKA